MSKLLTQVSKFRLSLTNNFVNAVPADLQLSAAAAGGERAAFSHHGRVSCEGQERYMNAEKMSGPDVNMKA
jgi:hypothetical protein